MLLFIKWLRYGFLIMLLLSMADCRKVKDLTDDNPEIECLREGFKTSAAIGYCVSVAATVLQGGPVPDNVLFESATPGEYSNRGIMYLTMNDIYPLPFNRHIGDIIIAGIWEDDEYGSMNAGVISIIFGNLEILSSKLKFYGIHTVPVIQDKETGRITAVFAHQDIVVGEGSDTLLSLSLSNPQFSSELARLDEEPPGDVFAAVSQNAWFISIDQKNTPSVYDDSYVITGGGQIAEATESSGGIQYHAMIGAELVPDHCTLNPFRGDAFIQNIRAGTGIDLGNIYLVFHDHCDGKAYVEMSSGEYLKYLGRNVNLNFD
jgi:hypothetical protein